MPAARPLRVRLIHPFTARSIGWSDESKLPSLHSAPHVRALRSMAASGSVEATVTYFTDGPARSRSEIDGLTYEFWPRSRRRGGHHDRYRAEWSHAQLAREIARPADVTILNLSGHGSGFARAVASGLHRRRRPYVAMIGGLTAHHHREPGALLRSRRVDRRPHPPARRTAGRRRPTGGPDRRAPTRRRHPPVHVGRPA